MKRMIAAALTVFSLGPIDVAAKSNVTLGRPGMSVVFVWNDHAAYREGIKLIEAGVHDTNPALVFRLIACLPKPGAQAIITEAGAFSHTILVIDGPQSGCRGFVTTEDVR